MLRAEMQRGGDLGRAEGEDEGRVPLFGTWRAIYTAIVATAVAVMVLLTLFSGWPW
jgi:hypothetical protein